jgi:hypothetical protein
MESATTETVIATTKVLTALDHLKNNRIEYLLVLLLSHFLGLTDSLLAHASGVCF